MPFLADGPSSLGRAAFSGVLLDQIREGLVRFDPDLTLLACNRPFLTLAGLEAHKARGRQLTDFLPPNDLVQLRAALTLFQRRGPFRSVGSTDEDSAAERSGPVPETQTLRLDWRSLDGRRVESRTVLFAAWETDGESDGRFVFNALIHDLTVDNLAAEERRRLQERVERTAQNESLGILAGGLAHDFNNVLTAITGLVDIARLQLPDDAEAKSTLGEISKTADYATILVRNLLSFAGRTRQSSAGVELSGEVRDLAQWILSTLRPKVELEVQCAAGLPPTAGDREQIRQAVTNLILNAEEALTHHQTAEDETARRRPPRIRVETGVAQVRAGDLRQAVYKSTPEPGSFLYVEVWDNGCGIEPDVRPRIFEPFFTTKVTGRGLGLAAVQGIAFSHQGFLTVDSEVGRGTSVRLYLPISNQVAPEPQAPAPTDEPDQEPPVVKILPRGSGRILVVDDEEAVRGIAAATLKMAGYEVTTAEDGQIGWEMVREQPDDFVCILLDITMPRMTGDEMLTRVREIRPNLPVVLSSGFSSNEACFSVTDDPHTTFLKKPYRARVLKETIADLIATAEPST